MSKVPLCPSRWHPHPYPRPTLSFPKMRRAHRRERASATHMPSTRQSRALSRWMGRWMGTLNPQHLLPKCHGVGQRVWSFKPAPAPSAACPTYLACTPTHSRHRPDASRSHPHRAYALCSQMPPTHQPPVLLLSLAPLSHNRCPQNAYSDRSHTPLPDQPPGQRGSDASAQRV